MADPLLSLQGVVKEYGESVRTRALDGVDVRLDSGEFVALMGPSGSGKSTLLNVIGLLDRPSSGRVMLAGEETTSLADEALTQLRGRTLGFVFQFHHLLPGFTALENVMLPEWGDVGYASADLRARAKEALVSVGLKHRMRHTPSQLSGGEAQRVAIARALSRRPALLLADEPTGNLDTVSANEVFDLLRTFNKERQTTCLIVTHDPRIADRCDRRIEIVNGRIVAPSSGR
jgi:lipoprotein-releasing system ATP-binding protein